MSYQALYRKYRPRTFSEVMGQEHVTTVLKNEIMTGNTAHAYIFSGSRGTGKTSTAKILARAVNCLSPENGEPCGKCPACRIMDGNTADIIEMDAASNASVNDIRAILEKVHFLPLELTTKVYILDEAHQLSSAANNALLKTLEEPPAHVMFILATTEPQSIPATILSRCQRFDFHRISLDAIVERVDMAARDIGASIDRDGLISIARAADGGMRDALSIADQCIAFCGNHVSLEDVNTILGNMGGEFLFGIAQNIIDCDRTAALRALSDVVSKGRDMLILANDLSSHFRALLLAKTCGDCRDMLDCTDDTMARYIKQAESVSVSTITRIIDILMAAASDMRFAPLPRIRLECAIVRITSPESELIQTQDVLINRIEKLETRLKNISSPSCAPSIPVPAAPPTQNSKRTAPIAPAAANPIHESPSRAAGEEPEDAASVFNSFKKAVSVKEPTMAALLYRATHFSLAGSQLTVELANKTIASGFISNESKFNSIMDSVKPGYSVKFILSGESQKNDIVEQAKKLFGDNIEILN